MICSEELLSLVRVSLSVAELVSEYPVPDVVLQVGRAEDPVLNGTDRVDSETLEMPVLREMVGYVPVLSGMVLLGSVELVRV